MDVKELIGKLEKMPQDRTVFVWDETEEEFTEISHVFMDSDGDVSLFISTYK